MVLLQRRKKSRKRPESKISGLFVRVEETSNMLTSVKYTSIVFLDKKRGGYNGEL